MTIVLGVVGAGVGYAIGGPAGARFGWSVGTVIGSYLDMPGPPKVETGKLDDLRFSGSSYGANLPRVWGKVRVGGNVVWAAEDASGNHLVEHKKKRTVGSGKSKGKVTEYWYSASVAVAFCVGAQWMPDDTLVYRTPVIKRLWADDKLIYDADAAENIVTPTLYSGSESQSPDADIVAAMGVSSGDAPAFRGICYAVLMDLDLSDFGNRVPNFSAEIQTDAVTVGNVYSDLARARGLKTTEIDTTQGTDTVDGFVELARGAGQQPIDALLLAYNFDQVEVDGKLKLVKRGGSPTFTLTADDIGAKVGGASDDAYTRKRRLFSEMPGRIDVRYFDVAADHQSAEETEVRQTADQANVVTFDLPLSLEADDARTIAARELDRAWFEDQTFDSSALHRFASIAPGDVGSIALRTGSVRVRVLRATPVKAGQIVLTLVPDDASVATQNTGGTGGGGSGGGSVETVVPSPFVVWSGRELVDAHEENPGFYAAASGDAGWRGCTIWYSLDGGVTYLEGPSISGRCVFGEATTALADP